MPPTCRELIRLALLILMFTAQLLTAQGSATIRGTVRDAQTDTPLPSATVILVGTSLGSPTDHEGQFVIRNVPPGNYRLRVSYIGYDHVDVLLDVAAGDVVERNLELSAVSLTGEEVIVTAQARGQKQAINDQLASNTITNVVSAARIQELPDANAAEAVGRLPGVSILRSGGEGVQIVVRGLQPKYNVISIGDVRMASSGVNDRGADLSMISSTMLDGIEVTKVVTPDRDPDVFGGTVNFRMREAKTGERGPGFEMLAQGGYNGLLSAHDPLNNYKLVVGMEGRIFDDRLGVFAQGDFERKNLTSEEVGAAYDHSGNSTTLYTTQALNLNFIPRDRVRTNGTINFDLKLPEGRVSFMNLFSSGTMTAKARSEALSIAANSHTYSVSSSSNTLSMLTNSITVEHPIAFLRLKTLLSHTYSETKTPDDWTVTFLQTSAGLSQFFGQTNLNPQALPLAATNDVTTTMLTGFTKANSFSKERALTAGLDVESDLAVGDLVTVTFKGGGKYRHQERLYTFEQFNNNASFSSPSARIATTMIAQHFPEAQPYAGSGSIPLLAFLDPAFRYGTRSSRSAADDYGSIINGEYRMSAPINYVMMEELARFMGIVGPSIMQQQAEGYARNNLASTTSNYSGTEDQTGAYLMATIRIGQDFTMIPGVRYQNLRTSYSAPQGFQSALSYYSYNHFDTTVTRNHSYWLPALILRYQPLSWFDLRLSYTNTLAYPDYVAITPRIDVASVGAIAWNNYALVPSRSHNYDAYASIYDNTIGLLTVGSFLKQIDKLIYPWSFYVANEAALPYMPQSLIGSTTATGTYQISTYVNNPYRVSDWGLEVDWQTHFWYLPRPLDGLVFNINYTRIISEARYPFTNSRREGRVIVFVDTSFTDRLFFQPNNILNMSVGYDIGGFSIRVSMLRQDDIFTGPNFWPQLRTSTAAYQRWDLSVRQTLPWFGIQVFGEVNNINGAKDVRLIRGSGYPQSQQFYGPTIMLGLRSRL